MPRNAEFAANSVTTWSALLDKLGLGALCVDDCYGALIDAQQWANVLAAGDTSLCDALDQAGLGSWQQAFHVAIDRWTGGAAESMLYTVLEPHAMSWEAIEMSVDLERTHPAGVTLLLLVLRDLVQGRLPLGFGVNRGLGAVKDVTVTVTPHAAPTFGTASFSLTGLPKEVKDTLNSAWQQWLKQSKQGAEAS